jgi:hypothetical protein
MGFFKFFKVTQKWLYNLVQHVFDEICFETFTDPGRLVCFLSLLGRAKYRFKCSILFNPV